MRIPPSLRYIVLLAILAAVVVVAALQVGIGVPKPVAIPIALLLVGLAVMPFNEQLAGAGLAIGIVLVLGAAFMTFYGAVKAWGGLVGTLVGVGVVAVAVGLAFLLVRYLKQRNGDATPSR